MNEDLKAKLKEKKGAVMGEDELDNVAGGSFDQNQDILAVMSQIDPKGVRDFTQSWDHSAPDAKSKLATGMMRLLQENGLNTSRMSAFLSADRVDNLYMLNGKHVGHAEYMAELQKHTWEFVKKK